MDNQIQRLREPAAWALVGSAGLLVLAGLIRLLAGGRQGTGEFSVKPGFAFRAYAELADHGLYHSLFVTLLVLLAVILVTRGGATPQAKLVAIIGLGVLGAVAFFGVITLLASMAADGPAGADKFAGFLTGLAYLGVTGIGGYYVFVVFQSLAPKAPPQPHGFPQPGAQPYQPGAQPYGQPQPGAQQYQPQPPPAEQHGQQPGQHGQQGQYPPPQPGGEQHQQPGAQPYGQQQYQQPGQYGQQRPGGQAGHWTQQYGSEPEPQSRDRDDDTGPIPFSDDR